MTDPIGEKLVPTFSVSLSVGVPDKNQDWLLPDAYQMAKPVLFSKGCFTVRGSSDK